MLNLLHTFLMNIERLYKNLWTLLENSIFRFQSVSMSLISLLRNPLTHQIRIKSKFFYQSQKVPHIWLWLPIYVILITVAHWYTSHTRFVSGFASEFLLLLVSQPGCSSLIADLLTIQPSVLPEPLPSPVILNLTHYLLLFL